MKHATLWMLAFCVFFGICGTVLLAQDDAKVSYQDRLSAIREVSGVLIQYSADHGWKVPDDIEDLGWYLDAHEFEVTRDDLARYVIVARSELPMRVEQWKPLLMEKDPDANGLRAVTLKSGSAYFHYYSGPIRKPVPPLSINEQAKINTEKATQWAADVSAQVKQVLGNGKNMFLLCQWEQCFLSTNAFASFRALQEASAERFSTSTEFFEFLMTSTERHSATALPL